MQPKRPQRLFTATHILPCLVRVNGFVGYQEAEVHICYKERIACEGAKGPKHSLISVFTEVTKEFIGMQERIKRENTHLLQLKEKKLEGTQDDHFFYLSIKLGIQFNCSIKDKESFYRSVVATLQDEFDFAIGVREYPDVLQSTMLSIEPEMLNDRSRQLEEEGYYENYLMQEVYQSIRGEKGAGWVPRPMLIVSYEGDLHICFDNLDHHHLLLVQSYLEKQYEIWTQPLGQEEILPIPLADVIKLTQEMKEQPAFLPLEQAIQLYLNWLRERSKKLYTTAAVSLLRDGRILFTISDPDSPGVLLSLDECCETLQSLSQRPSWHANQAPLTETHFQTFKQLVGAVLEQREQPDDSSTASETTIGSSDNNNSHSAGVVGAGMWERELLPPGEEPVENTIAVPNSS